MLDVSFGAGRPLRVLPGISDLVQVVPAAGTESDDRGGAVDVLLNLPDLPTRRPDWIGVAHLDAFRELVLNGGGATLQAARWTR